MRDWTAGSVSLSLKRIEKERPDGNRKTSQVQRGLFGTINGAFFENSMGLDESTLKKEDIYLWKEGYSVNPFSAIA
jgi:hypothetical protein